MKADPRATRFGIFQFKQISSSATARIGDPLWPTGNTTYPNGYGGTIADAAGPVEHAPNRFATAGGGNNIYFPATLYINNAASSEDAHGATRITTKSFVWQMLLIRRLQQVGHPLVQQRRSTQQRQQPQQTIILLF